MKILLFDMDGVLLEPRGYHRALQKTVALVGRLLGYRAVNLTPEDIVAFEAAGVASEWDSAAICAALLLENLWAEYPLLALPPTLAWPARPRHDVAPPNFRSFTRLLAQPHLQGLPPLKRAEHLLLGKADQAIKNILRNARQIEGSLTHRIFQELVLGSRVFAETYGLSPSLRQAQDVAPDTESYLLQYDRPTLSEPARAKLIQWLRDANHRAVIFTGRPSRPPAGHLSTPEAEIGAHGAGLEALPIVGLGGLSWLSAQRGCDPEAFLKPSAVHTLTALRLALGDPLEGALEAAATLVLDGQPDAAWKALCGAQVYVFEDTVSGLESIRAAQNILGEIGVPIRVNLFGIADSEPKRRALEAAGAIVTPTLSVALDHVGETGFRRFAY
jgi:hypothetical protein